MAEPPSKKLKTADDFLWWTLRDQDVQPLDRETTVYVGTILQHAKLMFSSLLTGIDVHNLKLYKSEADFDSGSAKAIPTTCLISDLKDSGTQATPFYIHYEHPAAPSQVTVDLGLTKADPMEVNCPTCPKLEGVELNTLLDVKEFVPFLHKGTSSEHKLFAHSTLKKVHTAVLDELRGDQKKRFITITGCPGTGKTWCGWLLAHSLVQAGTPTLNIGLRETEAFKVVKGLKHVYTVTATSINGLPRAVKLEMEDFMKEHGAATQVVIVDVGGYRSGQAWDIFTSVRSVLDSHPDSGMRVVAISSGHGQDTMTGKCQETMVYVSDFTYWSWTYQQFKDFQGACKKQEEVSPDDEAYNICGGSCRHYFDYQEDSKQFGQIVRGMDQHALKCFMNLDLPTSNNDGQQRSRLLAFMPIDAEGPPTMTNTQVEPRSNWVIQSIRQNAHTEFNMVARMYSMLKDLNKGAAGVTFELLVHIFWREAIKQKSKVVLTLKAAPVEAGEAFTVDCSEFKAGNRSIEHWGGVADIDPPLGYFMPDSQYNPVIDSILRFRTLEATRVLAIQVSIGNTHRHSDFDENPLLPTKTKPPIRELALWSCEEFPCSWLPADSEVWQLKYVYCNSFEQKLKDMSIGR